MSHQGPTPFYEARFAPIEGGLLCFPYGTVRRGYRVSVEQKAALAAFMARHDRLAVASFGPIMAAVLIALLLLSVPGPAWGLWAGLGGVGIAAFAAWISHAYGARRWLVRTSQVLAQVGFVAWAVLASAASAHASSIALAMLVVVAAWVLGERIIYRLAVRRRLADAPRVDALRTWGALLRDTAQKSNPRPLPSIVLALFLVCWFIGSTFMLVDVTRRGLLVLIVLGALGVLLSGAAIALAGVLSWMKWIARTSR